MNEYLKIWQKKPFLRHVYKKRFREIESLLVQGNVLEIGCGNGMLTQHLGKRCLGVDVDPESRAKVVTDAGCLALKENSFSNVVAVNVFHHIRHPRQFFNEALRILKKDGRLIIVEPYMGFLNHLVFRLFHHELCKKNLKYPAALEENIYHEVGNYYLGHSFFLNSVAVDKYLKGFSLTGKLITGSVMDLLSGGYNHRQFLSDDICLALLRIRNRFPDSKFDASRMVLTFTPVTDSD